MIIFKFYCMFLRFTAGAICIASVLLFGSAAPAQAVDNSTSSASNCADGKKVLTFIARDANGEYITDINFDIYEQGVDADGNVKPVQIVASGKTDKILGKKTVEFKSDDTSFAIRVSHLNKNVGSFYYYNNIIECNTEITKTLSGLKIVLRDSDGNLKKNQSYSIYQEKYDKDNNPIKEKKELVATINTGQIGGNSIYLASADEGIDGMGGYYIFESTLNNGAVFTRYNIKMTSETNKALEYIYGNILVRLKNQNGLSYSAGTAIELYEQKYDLHGAAIAGKRLEVKSTDDKGVAVFERPEGFYAIKILGSDGLYKTFYELEATDMERNEYEYRMDSTWSPASGACKEKSILKIVLRKPDGSYLQNMNVGLYEQGIDADGYPNIRKSVASGNTGKNGFAEIVIDPSSIEKYAVKAYQKSATAGEYWFFDNQFICGKDTELIMYLSQIKLSLKDQNGEMIKNQKVTFYEQKEDSKKNPILGALVGEYSTGENGQLEAYLAPDHPYDEQKKGLYSLRFRRNGVEYAYDNIKVDPEKASILDYRASSLLLRMKNNNNEYLANRDLFLYKQIDSNGVSAAIETKPLGKYKTNNFGEILVEIPAGTYAAVIKDDLNQDNKFQNIVIDYNKRTDKTLKANLTKITLKGADKIVGKIDFYSLKNISDNAYEKGAMVGSLKTAGFKSSYNLSLREGNYLISVIGNKVEYAKSFSANNNETQSIELALDEKNRHVPGKKYIINKTSSDVAERLKGYVLLQVEKNGEAWYVDMAKKEKHYMKDGEGAYDLMRRFGTGIKNADLEKIAIGSDERLGSDMDSDGLLDMLEDALGTDSDNPDTDGDGYIDGVEAEKGYNPSGSGKMPQDSNFAKRNAGKIFLQVEKKGEAWYVNPKNNRRYYLKDGDAAYRMMKYLSVGVKNADLEKIK